MPRNTKNYRTARPLIRGGSSGRGSGRDTVPSVQEQVDIPVLGASGPLDGRDQSRHHSDHQRSGSPASDISVLLGASGPSEDDQSQPHSGHQGPPILISQAPRSGTSSQRTRSPGRRNQVTPSGTYSEFLGLVNDPRPRKRKSASDLTQGERGGMTAEEIEEVEQQEEYEQQKLREFDQQVRLTSFRWHSNKFASQIIRQVYGDDFQETDPIWQSSKIKLFDNVRTQKSQMLARLEDHLKETRQNCPQLWALSDAEFRVDRFEALHASTFHHIWYYLESRIDFDGSEELGRYFIRTIYANLCVVCRDWMNTPAGLGKSDKRQVLLSVYDAAPLAEEFAEVGWDDFKITDKEVKRKKPKVSVKDILARSFKAVVPPPRSASGDIC